MKTRKQQITRKRRGSKRTWDGTGLTDYPIFPLGHRSSPRIGAAQARSYESLSAEDIARQVASDIEEFVARAYHLSVDRWTSDPDPLLAFERPREQAQKDLETRQSIERRLKSENSNDRKQAAELLRQLRANDLRVATEAAVYLFAMAEKAARSLEHLANARLPLMRAVAGRFSVCPVNLAIGKAKMSGGRDIQRIEFARQYLKRLQLNAENYWPETENSDASSVSFARLAAEQLYECMRLIRHDPFLWFESSLESSSAGRKGKGRAKISMEIALSDWGRDLLALSEPMTADNKDNWWRLARALAGELWKRKPEMFEPMKRQLASAPYTPAMIKSRIIDDGIKKAFRTLVITTDL